MRDVEHCQALGAEAADGLEQEVRLAAHKRSRRFVEHQDLRLVEQRTRDLDDLLFGVGQLAHERAGRQRDVESAPQRLRRLAFEAAAVDKGRARPARLVAEQQGLGDGQGRRKQAILMNEVDAEPFALAWRQRRLFDAVDLDDAGVRVMDAGEYLDKRRLAGTVLANEAVHAPTLDDQRRAVERLNAPEGLSNGSQREGGSNRHASCWWSARA